MDLGDSQESSKIPVETGLLMETQAVAEGFRFQGLKIFRHPGALVNVWIIIDYIGFILSWIIIPATAAVGGMPIFEPTEISYTVGHIYIYISLYPLHPYCSWISTVFMAYFQLYLYQHPMKMCRFIRYIPINTSLIFPMKPLRHFPRIKGSLLSVAWIFRTQSCHRRAWMGFFAGNDP